MITASADSIAHPDARMVRDSAGFTGSVVIAHPNLEDACATPDFAAESMAKARYKGLRLAMRAPHYRPGMLAGVFAGLREPPPNAPRPPR
jgi:hypothetical protein